MGINYLSTLYSSIVKKIAALSLTGKKLAVDGNSIFYPYWSIAVKRVCSHQHDLLENGPDAEAIVKEWITSVLALLERWNKSLKIDVTTVLDGRAPEEKQVTQKKRQAASVKYLTEAASIAETVCKNFNMEYVPGMVSTGAITASGLLTLDLAAKRQRHMLCINYGFSPLKADWAALASAIKKEGYKIVRSSTEGETLCCKMLLNGQVDYVLSSDCDCLAYLVPQWLSGHGYEDGTSFFTSVTLTDLLDSLSEGTGQVMTKEQFFSMCLLLGCDYNAKPKCYKNGKKLQLGAVGAKKMALQHKDIQSLLSTTADEIDWGDDFNAEACMDIFRLKRSVEALEILE